MADADVTVVVPVFNRANLVLEAIEAVARQSLLPRRLVVVDDGSTDSTADAVADWLQTTQPPFETHLIRRPRNEGVSAARNCGLAMARDCRYVAFLDSDDLWPEDFIERAYRKLAAHPEAVAAVNDRLHVIEDSNETQFFDSRPIVQNTTCRLFTVPCGIIPATLLTTKDVLELGGFDERLPTGQDADLFLAMSLRGPWIHVPGRPVTIRRFLPQDRVEAGHLSEKYNDNQRQWAQIHDDFIERKGGKRAVPRRLYTRTLADRWKCAGDQLRQAGRIAEARQCFRRSLRWRPWRSSVWAELLSTYVSRSSPNDECQSSIIRSTNVAHSSFVLRHSLDTRR
jgi:glycosyltransferase involved in cell wall biosynthesis